jgi:alpha-ketoglutarate-dependent sulfate ester dioxygenase
MSLVNHQTNSATTLDIRPITGRIGAVIHDVTLSNDLSPATVAEIRRALVRHKVIFFRGQTHLDEKSHIAFGRLLGSPVAHPTVPSLPGTDLILDIDGTLGRASSWHTDVTFVETPPQISILRGRSRSRRRYALGQYGRRLCRPAPAPAPAGRGPARHSHQRL